MTKIWTEDQIQKQEMETVVAYHGIQLETVLLDKKNGNESNIMSTCEIAGIKCLLVAEIDGCTDEGEMVEIKAHMDIHTPDQRHQFRRGKLLNTFMQCYLVGVPNVVIGFRDRAGILQSTKHYTLAEIEHECQKYWNKDFHMEFLGKVLSWALSQVEAGKVYHMSYHAGNRILFNEVSSPQNPIPQYFIDYIHNTTQPY